MKKLQKIKKTKGGKFYILSLLVAILAFSLVAMPVFAATSFTIAGMNGSQAGNGKDWTTNATGAEITLTSTFKKGCGSSSVNGETSKTMTLTNNSGFPAEVSFSASMTKDGTLKIDGKTVTSYSGTLAVGGKITIVASSPTSTSIVTSGSKTYTAKIFNVKFMPKLEATLTLKGNMEATLDSDGSTMEVDKAYTLSGEDSVTLKAKPEKGMMLSYWMVNNVPYVRSDTFSWNPTNIGDFVIEAHYAPQGTALFSAGGNLYDDLGKAVEDSASLITVVESGTLPEGETYTIPKGKTLLVPRQGVDDGKLTWQDSLITAQSVYRELIVPDNTKITVEGAMILSAKQGHSNPRTGSVIGPYGKVTLNGEIIVASGGQLDAFGYIKGDGMVTAEEGSNVREILEITDFCGGTKTSSFYKKMFPVSQYFIQNIQTDYKIKTGAKLEAHYFVYMTVTSEEYITYIDDSADAMFQLTDGYVIRHYDEDDPNNNTDFADRLTMELHGEMNSSSLAIKFQSVEVDSGKFQLPVPENMTLHITDGATFNMKNAYKLLPGTKIEIDNGGTLNLNSGTELYIYHINDYDYHYGRNCSPWSIAKDISGTAWGEAEIINNGLITINNGKFYESPLGGIIKGTGVIAYKTDNSEAQTSIYEYSFNNKGTDEPFSKVTLNGIGATKSDTPYHGTPEGIWYTSNGVVSIAENTTKEIADNQVAVDVFITPEYSVTDGDFEVEISYDNEELSPVGGTNTVSDTGLDVETGERCLVGTLVLDILDTCDGKVDFSVGDGTWTLNDYEFLTSDTEGAFTYYPTYTITYDQDVQDDWVTSYTVNDGEITLPVLPADGKGNAFLGWYHEESGTFLATITELKNYDLVAVWQGDCKIAFIDLDTQYMAQVREAADRQIMVLTTLSKKNDCTYTLGGSTKIYWSEAYQAYVAIVADTETTESLSAKLTCEVGATTNIIDYTGDVNGDGYINIFDAIIVNDILHGNRIAATSDEYLFRADVNGDKTITTADITLIKNEVLGGS